MSLPQAIPSFTAFTFTVMCMMVTCCGYSQSDDSSQQGSKPGIPLAAHLLDSVIFKPRITNPKKATILSAVLPGAGQVYNGQYYKLPILYGGIGAMLYVLDFNSNEFNQLDAAYQSRLAGEPTPDYPDFIPTSSIRSDRDQARKNRELSYFGLGLLYLFNVADAFVSSHLTDYDIDEDLSSIRVKPKLTNTSMLTGLPHACAGVTLTF